MGQGYVGLPLAISFAQADFEVYGLDTDLDKINKIKLGQSPVEDISSDTLVKLIKSAKFIPTDDASVINASNVIIVCVPTPLNSVHEPDLTFLQSAIKTLAKHISKGALIIVESTIAPGTMRNFVIPLIEKFSGVPIQNFEIAYSPERVDPLNKIWNLKNTAKIVAGFTEHARIMAKELYSSIIEDIIETNSFEAAETAKLLENAFRLVNISLINEISIFCQAAEIDINEVIKLAATKPYGFMAFYSGLGAGGHCIPVDPIYLSHKAKEFGVPINLIEAANRVNVQMPSHFVDMAEKMLGGLHEKKILVLGVSYKSNLADVRESPVAPLISELRQKGSNVFWHDDLVKVWNGQVSTPLGEDYDLAILATPHNYFDLTKLGDVPILNTRGSV